MSSPSAVVCREIFDENSQPSAEGLYSQTLKLFKYTGPTRCYVQKIKPINLIVLFFCLTKLQGIDGTLIRSSIILVSTRTRRSAGHHV